MPDTAHRDDMSPADAALLRHLRLWLLRTPLALPLLGTVAALLGGSWWIAVMASCGLAAVLKLWRILLCMLLCAAIAAVHEGMLQRNTTQALTAWQQQDAVELTGTITEQLGRASLLNAEGWGVTVALRGENAPRTEGDRVRVVAELREVEPPPMTGMFDRATWMRSRGLAAELDVIRSERLGSPPSWALLRGYATGMRHALAERLMPPGTEDDQRRQILCALVLGAREQAEPGTMLPFRRGGTLHAFAVSGMHVGLLAGFLWVLLRLLRVRPSAGRWLLLTLLAVYVLLTGFSVPAVRAYVMLATLLVGLVLRRRVGLANSWCFAALLVLLAEPWQIYSAGFLLSFAIYAAICAGARVFLRESAWLGPDAYIPPRLYTRGERLLREADGALRGTVIVSLVAWVVSLPLTCLLFHTVNPWGFVTNIAIAPVVPVVMLAGLSLLALAGIPLLGAAANGCALLSAELLLSLSCTLGYLPGAYLAATPPQPPQAAMVMGTGFGGSICVLGNPGLVIGCGNELTAALQVEPALLHAGFQPAALLLAQATQSHGGGAETLRATWPQLQILRAEEGGTRPLILTGSAGRFTLYPAPPELPRRPSANGAPIVRWEMPDGRRLLCVGEASRATWEQLPPEARQADILILGMNPHRPLDDPDLLRETGATTVLLLPTAAASLLQSHHAAPGGQLIRLGNKQCLMLP